MGQIDLRILDYIEPVISPWLGNPSPPQRTKHQRRRFELIRKADQFFDEQDWGRPFEVQTLAEALEVPQRTVFQTYRQLLGVSPRRYFEIQRLHQLRSRLRQCTPGETTITEQATEFGFADMGRLAGRYREHFGEYPQDTLKGIRASHPKSASQPAS